MIGMIAGDVYVTGEAPRRRFEVCGLIDERAEGRPGRE